MSRDDNSRAASDGVAIPLPVLRVINKSWDDPEFKRRLLADPAGVLKAEGVAVPPGVPIQVIEDTEKTLHLVLPNQQGAKNFTGSSPTGEGASIMYSRERASGAGR